MTDWTAATTNYSNDAASEEQQASNPNATASHYAYDLAGRLRSIVHNGRGAARWPALVTATTWRATERRRCLQGSPSYSYDALDRLTSARYPDTNELISCTYDHTGNRTALSSTVSGSTTYSYDIADRLLSAGPTSYTWDASGRQSTKTAGPTTSAYTFEALDRLTLISMNTPGNDSAYVYNGDGVRVARTTSGIQTSYVQDLAAGLPVVLVETTGGQDTRYVCGRGLIGQVHADGSKQFVHTDALGSTRALTDASGVLQGSYTYDAFGATRSQAGSISSTFTFTGEQTDPDSGLEFLRARYYDPQRPASP